MTTNEINKPPVWFWVVSIIALLWNLTGVFNYLMQAYLPIEQLEAMSQAERELYEGQPAWVTGAFAVAVFAGTIGCIALLIRKKWARPVLILSLISSISLFSYTLFISNTIEVYGIVHAIIMPILVVLIGIYLVFFAKKGIVNGWLK
ncbi:hypothetical protein MTsPCn9_32710 [Croceitalea sp. MTPC9]|uniref:hypothetical protein n=1 Tax=unclassified Croceitalea TaxID=2632280 RepID=UPI002B3EA189|nr:hypothetical protein MTsPCn6_33010 [Croceitalea sp. MTPC6]GMN18331.1 hypothetical protein MTsPCn9_32710 [Croceitalea sp. MTPC9]